MVRIVDLFGLSALHNGLYANISQKQPLNWKTTWLKNISVTINLR